MALDFYLLFPPAWQAFPISGISEVDLSLGEQTSISDREIWVGAGCTPTLRPKAELVTQACSGGLSHPLATVCGRTGDPRQSD